VYHPGVRTGDFRSEGGVVARRSMCDVLAAARRNGHPALVADIKCRSPRDGELISSERLEPYVRSLIEGGIDAMANPTAPEDWGGSLEIAARIRRISGLPLMRKEFFNTLEQMDESYEVGFDAVQLSLSTVPTLELLRAMKARAERLGMEVVVGVHSSAQLEQAVDLGAAAVGINNRDISANELDGGTVSLSETLIPLVPADVLILSESAFHTPADVARAAAAGADGVLIGTSLAKSGDPIAMLRSLRDGVEAWSR
jgi:indole-3-glycerol phosphate synthase